MRVNEERLVHEDLFEGEATGLEFESVNAEEIEHKPWDPNKIRVETKTFSIRNILDMIEERDLELAPDFQRNMVWKPWQKSRLIESLLLQIPLPAFYFAQDPDGAFRVVDGLQRLSTIRDFVRGNEQYAFKLVNLEYLRSLEGSTSDDLDPALRRRLNNTQIVVHVIDPATPAEVTFNIFKRLNTGGTPLNAQEIRHCMTKDRSRSFLRQCAANPNFHLATGGSLLNNVRMGDREAVLRFCAFRLRGSHQFQDVASMDIFLLETSQMIDDPERVPDAELERLAADFDQAMVNAYEVFGEHTFRKWWGEDARYPINRPLLETWSVALAELDKDDVAARGEAIRRAALMLMDDDRFLQAITSSTGDKKKVSYRFERVGKAALAK